jgi:hypothetical protein
VVVVGVLVGVQSAVRLAISWRAISSSCPRTL